jgi:hypothetical protein
MFLGYKCCRNEVICLNDTYKGKKTRNIIINKHFDCTCMGCYLFLDSLRFNLCNLIKFNKAYVKDFYIVVNFKKFTQKYSDKFCKISFQYLS